MLNGLQRSLAVVLDWPGIPIRPEPGSTIADSVDKLHFFLTGITLFFTFIIFVTIIYFAIRYRRRSENEQPAETVTYLPLELTWTLVPIAICVVIFIWSSSLYFENSRAPNASLEIFIPKARAKLMNCTSRSACRSS
jgi:cytochrome c oxidase subunit 2